MTADLRCPGTQTPTSRNGRRLRLCGPMFAALLTLAFPVTAWSRRFGIESTTCSGCHFGGAEPKVTLSASPENPVAGQVVTLTVTVSQTNGPIAGFYLTTIEPVFSTVDPVGTFATQRLR